MNYSESELIKKFKRKKALMGIVKEIENAGIKINYNKYPKYKNMETLRKIILDYQLLVPGEEPDLTEMTEAVDNVEPEKEVIEVTFTGDEEIINEPETIEPEEEEEEEKPFKPDWDKINSIDVVDLSTDEGRKNIVRKIYLEMLGREPDAMGLQIYKQHVKDGLGISHIRDAIRKSKEYKRKHNL